MRKPTISNLAQRLLLKNHLDKFCSHFLYRFDLEVLTHPHIKLINIIPFDDEHNVAKSRNTVYYVRIYYTMYKTTIFQQDVPEDAPLFNHVVRRANYATY
jgi:hypothetical protein